MPSFLNSDGVGVFHRHLFGSDDMTKPEFSVEVLDDGVAPSTVLFTDLIGTIVLWDFGDGVLGTFDEPKQRTITHVYKRAGTFAVKAVDKTDEGSDPYLLIIKAMEPAPEPVLTWWQRFVLWVLKLLGR